MRCPAGRLWLSDAARLTGVIADVSPAAQNYSMQASALLAIFLALCVAQGANAAAPSGIRAAEDPAACGLRKDFARDPDLAARLHRAFVVLKIAIDEDHDAAAVLASYPPADGYPYLYVVEAAGVLVHAQNAVGFMERGDFSARRLDAFIERWDGADE